MFLENNVKSIFQFDVEMTELVKSEEQRQRSTINLIASENYASSLATGLEGSIFANKQCEGYPGKRFAAGCEIADKVEKLAIERLKELFGCEHANIQSMSATIANVAVMNAVLKPGDTILSMDLAHGGHLSHGAKFHLSGKMYNVIYYGVDPKTEQIDLMKVSELAKEHKPKLIICGASSYPRLIDYVKFSKIAKSVGALLLADIAHRVGLIVAGVIPSPVPYADIVTTSTHKTWRGPRGCGIILCKKELAKKIDRSVFPGLQGAPKFDMIAARAVHIKETMTEEFKRYGAQVLLNAKALEKVLVKNRLRLISGGTDTHLILIDVRQQVFSGALAEKVLESVSLITNKNMIPFDPNPSTLTSGIRLGTPALTTRGMKEKEMWLIGNWVARALKNYSNEKVLEEIHNQVVKLADSYPLFSDEWLPQNLYYKKCL